MKKLLVLICLLIVGSGCGYTNPEVPAGHEGYVYESPRCFGTGGFRKLVTGPGNFGFSFWNNKCLSVDIRPKTYSEKFKILAKDQLNVSFKAHLILSPKKGFVKEVIEKHSGQKFYSRLIKEVFRSTIRINVQNMKSTEVKENREIIANQVEKDLATYLEKRPFTIISLQIGNIGYPEKVTAAIENKLKAMQDLETKKVELEMAKQNALIRVEEAKGIAKAQGIINKTLTSEYLQHEAIEAQRKMAGSPNTTVVYIPVGNMGVPLIKNIK